MRKDLAAAILGAGVLVSSGCQGSRSAVSTIESWTTPRSGLVLPTILHRELAAQSASLAQLDTNDPAFSRNDGLLGQLDPTGFAPADSTRIDIIDIQRTTWGTPRDYLIIRSRSRRHGSGY